MLALLAAPFFLYLFAVFFGFILLITIENDSPGWCSAFFLGGLLFLELATPYKPFTYLLSHPLMVAEGFAAYTLIGVVWCLGKWKFHVHNVLDRYLEHRQRYVTEGKSLAEATTFAKSRFKSIPPQISQHKSQAYMWIAYWPLSALWTLVNDPLRRFWKFIYNRLAGLLQTISDNAFAKHI